MSTQALITAQQLRVVSVQNQYIPDEGPIAVPLVLDFTVADSYTVNLQQFMATAKMSMVQAVFLDNRQGTTALSISSKETGQVLEIPAGAQAYLPILASNPATLVIAYAGADITLTVFLLNFPVAAEVWGVTAGGGSMVTIVAGTGILVDNTDPTHPVVSIDQNASLTWANAQVFQGGDNENFGIISTGGIQLSPFVVATLPTDLAAGAKTFVSDALIPVFGSPVTGGGAVTVPVYFDGAAWNVG